MINRWLCVDAFVAVHCRRSSTLGYETPYPSGTSTAAFVMNVFSSKSASGDSEVYTLVHLRIMSCIPHISLWHVMCSNFRSLVPSLNTMMLGMYRLCGRATLRQGRRWQVHDVHTQGLGDQVQQRSGTILCA